jgi:hypothetical protein
MCTAWARVPPPRILVHDLGGLCTRWDDAALVGRSPHFAPPLPGSRPFRTVGVQHLFESLGAGGCGFISVRLSPLGLCRSCRHEECPRKGALERGPLPFLSARVVVPRNVENILDVAGFEGFVATSITPDDIANLVDIAWLKTFVYIKHG